MSALMRMHLSLWSFSILTRQTEMDRDGNQDVLRFPPFHPDILEQRHWDAGDSYGRIKIVLAEGFSRPHRSPPFERVKDVVALSFQHAPLSKSSDLRHPHFHFITQLIDTLADILEYSNIAWPNPSMWHRPRSSFKYSSASIDTKDAEGHAHNTPTKESRAPLQPIHGQVVPRVAPPPTFYTNWATSSIFDVPISHWPAYNTQDPRWDIGQEHDIFTDPDPAWQQRGTRSSREDIPIDPTWQHRGARASRDDIPMLDYSSSNSRAISSVTGMSFEHSKQPSMAALMDEEEFNVLQESITLSSPSTIIKSRKEKICETGKGININKDDEKENGKGIEKVVETAVEKEKEKEDDMVTPKKV